jgi:hypothetical protein
MARKLSVRIAENPAEIGYSDLNKCLVSSDRGDWLKMTYHKYTSI